MLMKSVFKARNFFFQSFPVPFSNLINCACSNFLMCLVMSALLIASFSPISLMLFLSPPNSLTIAKRVSLAKAS